MGNKAKAAGGFLAGIGMGLLIVILIGLALILFAVILLVLILTGVLKGIGSAFDNSLILDILRLYIGGGWY